jgi:hypothetical protein
MSRSLIWTALISLALWTGIVLIVVTPMRVMV